MDLVTAAGAGVSVELMGRNMREFAEASIPQRLLWLAGLPHNGDPVEDLDDDWSLDPWLYQVSLKIALSWGVQDYI